ncbi:hypothetical protein [Methylobacterium sp. A54F]
MSRSTILLEFNELTPMLMDRFIAQGHLPAFKKLRDQSLVCISDADEKAPELEPWIQWVTVHTGLPYSDHRVFDLGDGVELKAKRTWDYVADAGMTSWVCGSMNAAINTDRSENLYILPDPWSQGLKPNPEAKFSAFYHLVRSYVQEYTRDKPPLTRNDFLRFGQFMLTHGLSPATVQATVRQLLGERVGATSRWRRAAILDRLQWDVFRHFYRALRPAYSTFFLNSTAHYQHYYWRNMDPESFSLKDAEARQAEYSDAILFGYKKMDGIVAECLELAGPDTTIVLATALSQQPLAKYDGVGGKQIFKINDVDQLMKFAGIQGRYEYAPVMAEQFHMFFETEGEAEAALARLEALRTSDGQDVMAVRRDGAKIFGGCQVNTPPGEDTVVRSAHSNATPRFNALFYPVDGLKSGMHHPDGILWIRTPEGSHRTIERKIPIQEIGATLLELTGISTRAVGFPHAPMPEVTAILRGRTELRAVA